MCHPIDLEEERKRGNGSGSSRIVCRNEKQYIETYIARGRLFLEFFLEKGKQAEFVSNICSVNDLLVRQQNDCDIRIDFRRKKDPRTHFAYSSVWYIRCK